MVWRGGTRACALPQGELQEPESTTPNELLDTPREPDIAVPEKGLPPNDDERYELDGRSLFIPKHEGSFRAIAHRDDHLCVIDERDLLYCVDRSATRDAEERAWVEPVARDVSEVKLT